MTDRARIFRDMTLIEWKMYREIGGSVPNIVDLQDPEWRAVPSAKKLAEVRDAREQHDRERRKKHKAMQREAR